MDRQASIRRSTQETEIELRLAIDRRGTSRVSSGIGFLDHMLELFARHSGMELFLEARGDLRVDSHHTVEDIGICLGQAVHEALGDKAGITRYGQSLLPMDETLVQVAIDLSGRPYLVFKAAFPTARLGEMDTELIEDFWQAFANQARCNLHIVLQHGRNSHHICEAIFKGVARSLRMAVARDPSEPGIPSTKGIL